MSGGTTSRDAAGSVRIEVDDLTRPAVQALLAEHLAEMHATTCSAESVHALELDELRSENVTVWTAWIGDEVVGCVALKVIEPGHGELKSMRTTATARGRGVGSALLEHVLDAAAAAGLDRVSLETGTEDYFAPARRLYERLGFTECPPFGSYRLDPLSVFYTLPVSTRRLSGADARA